MTKHGLSLLERIELHYIPEPNSGCWLWEGGTAGNNGYAAIARKSGSRMVHKIMYEIHKGKTPKGKEVRHTCDMPICINPDHLLLGTHADNMRDASVRKRFPDRSGDKNNLAKLTAEQVREIRADPRGSNTLARVYSVDRTLIWAIRANRIWKNV